jgi:hypothetical protein
MKDILMKHINNVIYFLVLLIIVPIQSTVASSAEDQPKKPTKMVEPVTAKTLTQLAVDHQVNKITALLNAGQEGQAQAVKYIINDVGQLPEALGQLIIIELVKRNIVLPITVLQEVLGVQDEQGQRFILNYVVQQIKKYLKAAQVGAAVNYVTDVNLDTHDLDSLLSLLLGDKSPESKKFIIRTIINNPKLQNAESMSALLLPVVKSLGNEIWKHHNFQELFKTLINTLIAANVSFDNEFGSQLLSEIIESDVEFGAVPLIEFIVNTQAFDKDIANNDLISTVKNARIWLRALKNRPRLAQARSKPGESSVAGSSSSD